MGNSEGLQRASLLRTVGQEIPRKWDKFWYPSTDPFDIGFARFLFFGWVFYSTLSRNFLIWGDLPEELFYPMPFMRLVNYQVVSASTLEIFQNVWRVSLILGCIGLFTRISALVGCILSMYLWTLGFGYSQEAHGSIPLIFSMFVLAVARSADAFSIDSLLFRGRHRSRTASPEYGWPARVICCIYVLMFFGSGVTKIVNSGIGWGLHALTDIFYKFRLTGNPVRARTIDFFLNNFPMPLLGTGALLLELAAPLALFGGLVRVIILLSLVTMQLVINEAMGLDFRPTFALIPFFVPWTNLRRALSEKARRVWSR